MTGNKKHKGKKSRTVGSFLVIFLIFEVIVSIFAIKKVIKLSKEDSMISEV